MSANIPVEFNETSARRFEVWFREVAKPGVAIESILQDMLEHFALQMQQDKFLVYELATEHALAGHPEHFHALSSELVPAGSSRPPHGGGDSGDEPYGHDIHT